jgi:hypothetical protein
MQNYLRTMPQICCEYQWRTLVYAWRHLCDLVRRLDRATCRKSWRVTARTMRTVRAAALRCRLILDHAYGALGRGKYNRIFQRNKRVNFARFRV